MRRRPSGSTSEEGESPLKEPLDVFGPDLEPQVRTDSRCSGEAARWDGEAGREGVQNNPSPNRLAKAQDHDWKPYGAPTKSIDDDLSGSDVLVQNGNKVNLDGMTDFPKWRRSRLPSLWATSLLTITTTLVSTLIVYVIVQSFLTRQLDPKGCELSYMRPAFAKYSDFDTEHTRFASKYSLYLYREGGIDEDTRASHIEEGFNYASLISFR